MPAWLGSKRPALEELLLANTRIGDAGIEHLVKLPKLKRLRLSGSKVTDAGMAGLAAVKTFEDLELSQTAIGDEGLTGLPAAQAGKAQPIHNPSHERRPGSAPVAPA